MVVTNHNLSAVSIPGGGSLTADSRVNRGELNAKWLLLDFGERSAVVASAKEQLMATNVGFNAAYCVRPQPLGQRQPYLPGESENPMTAKG